MEEQVMVRKSRRDKGVISWVEHLEPRQLFTVANPTANEQYMLELINRARANPTAEAKRNSIALNEGPPGTTITTAAKQPLAFNLHLVSSARIHSQDMITHDYFDHKGFDNSQPTTRMTTAGYVFGGQSLGSGENIAWTGNSASIPNQTTTTATLHQNLFVDTNVAGRGHRVNLMNDAYKEVGIGIVSGVFSSGGTNWNAVMATQDFAFSGSASFLTGVAYTDKVTANHFYTPGEGLGGLTITALRASDNASFHTTTFSSGGYTLPLDAGTYTVTASGGSLASPITVSNVVIGATNVKVDFVPGSMPAPDITPPAAKITAANVTLAGAKTYSFKVTYKDATAVKSSTLATGNLIVTNTHGFSYTAKLVSKTSATDASTITATYRIVPPGGAWDAPDNGTYTIALHGGKVSDTLGHFMAAKRLGTFSVSIA
jgi:hypothetical protein